MVVEDDAFERMAIVSKINQICDDVTEAADGIEALRLLRSESFDLVIADLEMPNLNGYELLSCIRVMPRLQHLPVIILTGHEDRASLERALISGATSFLVKPLNWEAFHKHIEHILHISQAARISNLVAAH